MPASSRVNPLPQGRTKPEGSAEPVGAGSPAKRPERATPHSAHHSISKLFDIGLARATMPV
ncbi:hypothetical protein C6A77_03750 [Pseudomonas sp. AFG_SD02_1510_Pfu_092]|nr:hypothetical protein C6A77_03750 [Pseudomonas sp. AFG_SD02_1510_Pfu_092]